jgi:3-keto-5-aminohexanoate cleavage enzyme
MHRRSIKPCAAILEAGMIENAMHYVHRGLIGEPLVFNFVLGQAGAMPATARNLMFLVQSLPLDAVWEVTGHSGGARPPQAHLHCLA